VPCRAARPPSRALPLWGEGTAQLVAWRAAFQARAEARKRCRRPRRRRHRESSRAMPSRPASEPGVAAVGRGYRPTGRLEGGLTRQTEATDGLREHTAEARSGCRRPGGGKSLVAGARIRPTLLELSPTPVPRPTENPRCTSRTLQPNPNPVPERRPSKSERRKRAGRRHAQESGVLCLHHKTNHHARERNGKVPRRRACLRPAGRVRRTDGSDHAVTPHDRVSRPAAAVSPTGPAPRPGC
jgi:hypothetical protein